MDPRNKAITSVDSSVRLLLATDFDGTIAPIVSRPEQAQIHLVAERFLKRCAEIPSIAVAVVSGRDVDDVRRRIGGIRAIVAGSHGLECADASGRLLWTTEQRCPEVRASLLRDLLRANLRIERKKFAVAVHFRGVPSEARTHVNRLTSWADEENLDVFSGRKVVEVRVRGGGKRAAVRAIASRLAAGHIVYAGDDTTDFPALAYAVIHGRAIFVENEELEPPDIAGLWRVASIEDLCYGFARELIDVAPDLVPLLYGDAAERAPASRPGVDVVIPPTQAGRLVP